MTHFFMQPVPEAFAREYSCIPKDTYVRKHRLNTARFKRSAIFSTIVSWLYDMKYCEVSH